MKNMKMTKNRKGFSLAEMVIVIAIIVILAGASAVGVVAWVQNANKTKEKLEAENGDNFEVSALAEVASAVPSAPSYVIPKETAETPAEEETTTVKQEDPTTTAKQHEDPTTTAKQEDPTTTAKQEDPTTTAKQQGNPTTTAKQQSGGTNASGSSVSIVQNDNNNWHSSMSFNKPVSKVVIYTNSSSFQVNGGSGYNCTSLGNGRYEITWAAEGWGGNYRKLSSINFNVDNNTSEFYVVSFE